MKVLQQDIKSGEFKKIYLLFGTEAYLRMQWRDNMLKALLPAGDTMNLTRYEGAKTDQQELVSMSQTLPFFAERRVVLAENTGYFKRASVDLEKLFADMPDTTCLIFVEREVDKRQKNYKYVSRNGYAAELNTPTPKQLVTWIGHKCQAAGKKISASCADYILDQCGTDMMQLSNELEKLISYAADRDVIAVADVDAVCTSQVTGKIFDMMDAMALHQSDRMLKLYRDLLELREDPVYILSQITRQIRILTEFKGLVRDEVPFGQLAAKAGVREFTTKKYVNQCKAYSYDQLLHMFDACHEMDRRVKSGLVDPTIGVELMLVEFTRNA